LDDSRAVVLSPSRTLGTIRLQAAQSLSAHTNTIAHFDVLDILAYSHSFANDLMANTASFERITTG
jgi:hypothetical protein